MPVSLASPRPSPKASSTTSLSTDTWAVFFALLLAAAIRFGVLKTIPW